MHTSAVQRAVQSRPCASYRCNPICTGYGRHLHSRRSLHVLYSSSTSPLPSPLPSLTVALTVAPSPYTVPSPSPVVPLNPPSLISSQDSQDTERSNHARCVVTLFVVHVRLPCLRSWHLRIMLSMVVPEPPASKSRLP